MLFGTSFDVTCSSFKTEPYQIMDNAKLLQSEQNALFKVQESALTFNQGILILVQSYNSFPSLSQDLNGLNRHANLRKINDFAKRARTVKNHAIVISELSKKMPKVRLVAFVRSISQIVFLTYGGFGMYATMHKPITVSHITIWSFSVIISGN